MSWILLTALAFAIAFGGVFVLCEWLSRRLARRSAARRRAAGWPPRS